MKELKQYCLTYKVIGENGSLALASIRVVLDNEKQENSYTEKQKAQVALGTPKARLRTRNGKKIIEVFNRKGTFKRVKYNPAKGVTLANIKNELENTIKKTVGITDIKKYCEDEFNSRANNEAKTKLQDWKEHFEEAYTIEENAGDTTKTKGLHVYISYRVLDAKGKKLEPYYERVF